MVENIKQTKDAQAPSDPKTNEVLVTRTADTSSYCPPAVLAAFIRSAVIDVRVSPPPVQKLYTVCDVAMHIIMSKSTTYSLESPKDPVLPTRFFTKPDKVRPCAPKRLPEFEIRKKHFCLRNKQTALFSVCRKEPFSQVLHKLYKCPCLRKAGTFCVMRLPLAFSWCFSFGGNCCCFSLTTISSDIRCLSPPELQQHKELSPSRDEGVLHSRKGELEL